MKKTDLATVIDRSLKIRERYHALERQHHGSVWSVEEDALAFLTDAALVGRLTMAHAQRWPKANAADELEHKLGESIWWLIVLAQRMDIDITTALEGFLDRTEELLAK